MIEVVNGAVASIRTRITEDEEVSSIIYKYGLHCMHLI